MLSHDEVLHFFKKKTALSMSVIEKEAGLPVSTLPKALAGQRTLNQKHLKALEPVLLQYGLEEFRDRKARVISIVNHKGGVGKTTTTINLGSALVLAGYRVLVIDIDSQGNLSQSLGLDNPEVQLYEALLQGKSLPIVPIVPNFDLVPSSLELAKYERELTHSPSGALRLRTALNAVLPQYDYILIDCPPALNVFTNSALIASNAALVTLEPETSAIKGINNLFELINEIRQFFNEFLSIEGILFTRVDRRLVLHKELIQTIRQDLQDFRVFDTEIRLNAALKESQYAQVDIFRYAAGSPGAQDYKQLAQELLTPVTK
ncbi:chromosome partitioning protein [Siphonobacter sp. BAB-5385]|uniref:ParA family protein n=1 Tax=unclassified Siphonobacter TaxID=2635712 RepID=UPI000B9E0CB0|nr:MULTISPECIES: ParA family protein [unclassified Siphonobacter]OZI08822.1 chromosome partitioning protein [Siphonobacter sp. BAB-5385]PMD92551.1 chromosome partitioning protein [Siphonobacter sp. BAB-5405]